MKKLSYNLDAYTISFLYKKLLFPKGSSLFDGDGMSCIKITISIEKFNLGVLALY
jgi:hypothetical protein